MTNIAHTTGEILQPRRWRLLLITGQIIDIEAIFLSTTGHGVTFKDANKTIVFSLPSEIVLLIKREDLRIGVSAGELMAAWDKAHGVAPDMHKS